jgi:hypothetical protein
MQRWDRRRLSHRLLGLVSSGRSPALWRQHRGAARAANIQP